MPKVIERAEVTSSCQVHGRMLLATGVPDRTPLWIQPVKHGAVPGAFMTDSRVRVWPSNEGHWTVALVPGQYVVTVGDLRYTMQVPAQETAQFEAIARREG